MSKFPALHRIGRDLHGTAAVEFALVMPMLLLLLLGLGDYATLISRTLQVNSAAHAGAAYAQRHGWDAAAITRAASAGLATLDGGRAAPRLSHGCLQADASIVATHHCAGGGKPGDYVTVTVTARSMPLLLRGALLPRQVSGEAVVRIG